MDHHCVCDLSLTETSTMPLYSTWLSWTLSNLFHGSDFYHFRTTRQSWEHGLWKILLPIALCMSRYWSLKINSISNLLVSSILNEILWTFSNFHCGYKSYVSEVSGDWLCSCFYRTDGFPVHYLLIMREIHSH